MLSGLTRVQTSTLAIPSPFPHHNQNISKRPRTKPEFCCAMTFLLELNFRNYFTNCFFKLMFDSIVLNFIIFKILLLYALISITLNDGISHPQTKISNIYLYLEIATILVALLCTNCTLEHLLSVQGGVENPVLLCVTSQSELLYRFSLDITKQQTALLSRKHILRCPFLP